MKKAITVVITAILPVLAKRVKLGVAVPPLTKEPMTRPTPPNRLMLPEFWAKMAARPPPCRGGGDHGVDAQHGDQRHADVADDLHAADAEVGGGGHADAGQDDQQPGAAVKHFRGGMANMATPTPNQPIWVRPIMAEGR